MANWTRVGGCLETLTAVERAAGTKRACKGWLALMDFGVMMSLSFSLGREKVFLRHLGVDVQYVPRTVWDDLMILHRGC